MEIARSSGRSGIRPHLGHGPGDEEATEQQGRDSAANARQITWFRHKTLILFRRTAPEQRRREAGPATTRAPAMRPVPGRTQGAMVKETLSSALLEPWVTATSKR